MATVRKIYEGLKKHDGSINELAKRSNRSREWVRQVLTSKQEDSALLLIAAKLWRELEMEENKQMKEAERLAQEAESISNSNLALA